MDGITRYRTTDLDLTSPADPTALATALVGRGFALARRVVQYPDGEWFCGFAWSGSDEGYDGPESEIADMLGAIESLDPLARSAWEGCSRRLFDSAFDCGPEPFHFYRDLSAGLLVRLAAAGATVRITLYPDRETGPGAPGAATDCGGTEALPEL
jgi:hypothetical protein